MNSLIETLNAGGDCAVQFAWPMLWQSSLLIGLFFALERMLRRKVRAAVRYALWLVVLAKLLLPPSLALPTGLSWWLRPAPPAPKPRAGSVIVRYGPEIAPSFPVDNPVVLPAPTRPALSAAAVGLTTASAVSLGLLAWMLLRWRKVARRLQSGIVPPAWLEALLDEARRAAGLRRPVRLRLLEEPVSPAVYGLLQPTIVLPRLLSEQLPPAQLQAVLLHELVHLRRGDVWVNCVQALLQLAYWWHPLLWLANARLRRLREEAVDDAVMEALAGEAETYAPTLLEVARLALQRPLASLGLVGIFESRSSLRQRIERLLDFRPPRRAGLTLGSVVWVLAFGALALPMGEPPAGTPPAGPDTTNPPAGAIQKDIERAGQGRTSGASSSNEGGAHPNQLTLHTNLIRTSKGRRVILAKLDGIRLQNVTFDGLPFSEVVRWLGEESRNRDAEGKGINFTIADSRATARNSINPATGLPMSSTPAETGDISTIPISIAPPLRDIRLADALDAITKAADGRIKYSIEDYGIIFSARTLGELPPLYVRMIKVDPKQFLTAVRTAAGLAETSASKVQTTTAMRDFFSNLGVDLAPPKSVFLSEREGWLMVRATLQDLDKIERALAELHKEQPQINIKAKFIEIPEESVTNFWNGLGLAAVCDASQARLLTPRQAGAALKMLQSTPGCELASESSVTTLSGRQAEVQTIRLMSVVTNINPRALKPPGVSASPTNGNGLYLTAQMPIGPTLDLLPHVMDDGSTIKLTVIPTLAEFLGYDTPTNSIAAYVDGRRRKVDVPRPRFQVRSQTNSAAVLDGHTLVLDGLLAESVVKIKDKVSGLGDLPLVGGLFRSESKTVVKKRMLVFITPTLIDPTGRRLHGENWVPAASTK